MADATIVPHKQRNDGLGHWHPAQRPQGRDSQDYSHGQDEQRIQVPLHSVIGADIGLDSSVQEAGLPSGITAGHELTAQTAPEDDHSESQVSDGACLHQETLHDTDIDFPVHEDGIQTPERKDVGDIIKQGNHEDSKFSSEDVVDVPGEDFGSPGIPRDEIDEGQDRSQESAAAFQPDLPWNIDNQAATTISDTESSFGKGLGMDRFQRTNSFPDVPPLPQPSMLPHSLPHTQVETIMEVFEKEEALANGFDESFSSKPTVRNLLLDTSDDHTEEVQNHFFPSSSALQEGHMPSLPDEEARFEEGLPLMHNFGQEDVSQGMYQEPVPQEGPRYPTQYAEEHFFDKPLASVSKDEDLFQPPVFDRKTTNQVLNSLQYSLHNETHDDPQIFDEMSPPGGMTGDGNDVSSNTASSQVPSGNHSNSQELSHTGEDLAALWQAALDDDELLDDDGEADPSSLFDDDEGFLEDDQNSGLTQSVSSPSSQLVYSLGGSIQGLSDAQSTNNSKDLSMSNRYNPSTVPQQQHQNSRGYQPSQGHSAMKQQPIQTTNGLNNPFSAPTRPGTTERQQLSYGYATSSSRPQMPSSAQSFADKNKGGYTSPYDLPMDLSRPKKRNLTQQLRPSSSTSTIPDRPPAPPRSSSMFAGVTPVVESQPPAPTTLPKQPNALSSVPHLGTAISVQKTKANAGSFFEELPSVKPRPILATARTHTANAPQVPPAPLPSVPKESQQSYARQRPASSSSNNHPGYGVVPPGPISPYTNVPHQGPAGPAIPSPNARHSPAPVPSSSVPPSRTRYAASPAGGARAPPSATFPFQPRTSSPLAQYHIRPRASSNVTHADDMSGAGSISSLQEPTEGHSKVLDAPSSVLHSSQPQIEPSEYIASHWASNDSRSLPDSSLSNHFFPPAHPATRYGPTSSLSTPSHAVDAPGPRHLRSSEHSGFEGQYTTSPPPDFAPPRRSQTQSPGAATIKQTLPSMTKEVYQRPASVNDRSLPQPALVTPVTSSHGTQAFRGLSQISEYITPTDGRENDPLERWKGCPLFAFGFGGTVVTSFPKKVQRYGAKHSTPLIKCSPGEVKIQPRNNFIFDSKFAGFPGPLKAKGKKKEVLDWLQRQIQQLEQNHGQIVATGIPPDPRTRSEEKILLWKIMNVLVEHDGVTEGKPTAEKAIRLILSPELVEDITRDKPVYSNSHLLGISGASGSRTVPTSTEIGDIENMRRVLLRGERDKAVWHAVDRRLWAHAMLISSTMDKSIWKQVLQEFIRHEVKSVGNNTESLASLYQIFAGNWEESIDELVPPSARAGLQFVSKAAGTGPTKNALDGLDRWRETLTLALSNRTHGDGEALIALGRLLAGYGRVEAAHICFIFAKAPGTFGGSDDPQASVTLLGADHIQHPLDFSRDIDSILLTEVYEFACTILASSPSTTTSPHFQAYRLYHAMVLAEHGLRTDAQEYCNVITSAMKSTTKLSPYYHSLLFTSLDDLVNRLRQAPSANSASWMSKPSLDRVSGSFLSRVNQFIAGEESDADSAASGKGTDPAAGPFAGVTGDTPNISRSPSSTDLYSAAYPSAPPPVNPIASTSRYAPGGQYAAQGQYTPRSSFEQSYGTLQDYRGSLQNETLRPQPPAASRPSSSGHIYQQPPQQTTKSSYQPISQPSTYPIQQESYPTPPSIPETVPTAPPEELSPSLYGQEPFRHASNGRNQSPQGSPQPLGGLQEDDTQQTTSSLDKSAAPLFGPTQSIYQPPSYEYEASTTPGVQSSYEPPTTSLYEPPVNNSNNTDIQPDNSSPAEEKRSKKTFMDDDEDGFEARAAALLKQDKARKDREAEEAFRKAAEADAQKGPDLKAKKSGWLGGWFGGAKKEGDLSSAQSAPNAPIKAKLGEESSFYYDKELKKWVNKKAGGETPAASSATPPPPKGPPSRAVSGSGAPPTRKDTDTPPPVPPLPSANSTATPPISVTGPPGAALGQAPSPYSSNSVSRSESPGVVQGEQTGPSRGLGIATSGRPPSAPPSRPATGMSNASSIDDLIGAPQARQGGTIKKGKKARGYIDVMANK